MSVRVLSWVFEHSPVENPVDRFVLIALADCARDDGTGAFPSIARLRRMTRWSRRTIDRSIDRLKMAGAIEAVGQRSRGVVEYRIAMIPTSVTETLVEHRRPASQRRSTSVTETLVPASQRRSDQRQRDVQPVRDPSVEPSLNRPDTERARAPVSDHIRAIFEAWHRTLPPGTKRSLTDHRRRKIKAALGRAPLEDCLDAVKGWRWDAWAGRAQNDNNDVAICLRASNLEKFRDWERGINRPPGSRNGRRPSRGVELAERYMREAAAEMGR